MLFSAPTDAGSLYISCCSFLTFALHKMGCNQLLKLARKCSFVWYLFKIEIIFCLLLDETKNFIPCWFTSGRLVGWSVISFSPPNSEWFYANAFMQCTCVHNKLHLMPRSGHKGQSTFATKFDLLSVREARMDQNRCFLTHRGKGWSNVYVQLTQCRWNSRLHSDKGNHLMQSNWRYPPLQANELSCFTSAFAVVALHKVKCD